MSELVLFGYWRSTAAYRVRIALAFKGLDYEQQSLDLRAGAQRDAAFLAKAPQGLVPVLATGQGEITQSLAIMEWLEERHPEQPLLPTDVNERAIVRSMAAAVACDIHPLNNLRVLQALRSDFGADAGQIEAWIGRWIGLGFAALEALIGRYGGTFAFGDRPGLADCCLVPQVYSARRYQVPLEAFPSILAVDERARALPAFAAAHPDRQADAERG
jgi:maleylpyruvate isomerase